MGDLLLQIFKFLIEYGGDILSFYFLINYGGDIFSFCMSDKIPVDLLKIALMLVLASASFYFFSSLATKFPSFNTVAEQ